MAKQGVTIQLRGGKEVLAAFRELRDELPKNALRSAFRSSGERMRRVIIGFAPHRTGRLVQALGLQSYSRGGSVGARVTISTAGKRDDPENAFYWRFLEFGWHDRAGVPHRMEFVRPAFETEASDAAQNVINALSAKIDQVESKARTI